MVRLRRCGRALWAFRPQRADGVQDLVRLWRRGRARNSDITKECSIQDNSTVLIMQGVKSSNSARFWIGRQTRSNSCQEVQRGQGSLGGKVRTHSHAVRRGLIRTKHFTTVRDLFGTVLEVIRKSSATQESQLPFLPVSIKPNIYRSGATRFARRAPQKIIVF